jgi:hypothetical protein
MIDDTSDNLIDSVVVRVQAIREGGVRASSPGSAPLSQSPKEEEPIYPT